MDKLCRPAPSQLHITITLTMSTPEQPDCAVLNLKKVTGAPVPALRRLSPPVPAPRRIRGQELNKPVFCPAPCCVQSQGGECPPGQDVSQPVPMPAERVETRDHEPAEGDYPQVDDEVGKEPGEGQPDPALASSGRQRRQERRKVRREEEKPTQERRRLRRKEKRIKITMINSDSSSSEEETCQEIKRITLDESTEPWDGAVYNNTTEYYNKIAEVENSGCQIVKLSGHLHIERHPCYDQHNEGEDENEDQDGDEINDDDDSNVHDDSTDEEDVKPEYDNDTEFEYRDHEPEEGDRHQEDDEAVREHEGIEDLGEEDEDHGHEPEEGDRHQEDEDYINDEENIEDAEDGEDEEYEEDEEDEDDEEFEEDEYSGDDNDCDDYYDDDD